jgi:hypothetical protein
MAKYTDDYVLDGSALRVAEGNELRICAGQPTSFADSTTRRLGSIAMTPGTGGGDYSLANGDVNGRKVTVAAQTGIAVATTGTADHVAIVDTVNSRLLHATTMPSQTVTAGNTANTAAWDAEFGDVTP